jgi:UDP-glucose 4-epimerase
MGEDPLGDPYNLLPLLGQVAVGRREKLMVYGTGRFTSKTVTEISQLTTTRLRLS